MLIFIIGPGSFQLPDNFTGGLSDALRLVADYHEEQVAKRKAEGRKLEPGGEISPDLLERLNKINAELHEESWDRLENGMRLTINAQLIDVSEDGKAKEFTDWPGER